MGMPEDLPGWVPTFAGKGKGKAYGTKGARGGGAETTGKGGGRPRDDGFLTVDYSIGQRPKVGGRRETATQSTTHQNTTSGTARTYPTTKFHLLADDNDDDDDAEMDLADDRLQEAHEE